MSRTSGRTEKRAGRSADAPRDERDRRRWERRDIDRPCKVYHAPSARFISGRAANVSTGGALIAIEPHRSLRAGDEVQVAIAWADSVVLPVGSMIPARVVRVGGDDRAEAIALEYGHTSARAGA